MNEDCEKCEVKKSMFKLKWTPDGSMMLCSNCGNKRLENKQPGQKELTESEEIEEEEDE